MATTAIILFCTFSVTTILSSDTTWFKNTQFHDANVVEIQNGWIDCPDWKPAISTNIGFSMNTSIFSTSTTATDNHTYNFTAKCIAIQVPLIWNEDDLHYMNHIQIIVLLTPSITLSLEFILHSTKIILKTTALFG
eukprot:492224_1